MTEILAAFVLLHDGGDYHILKAVTKMSLYIEALVLSREISKERESVTDVEKSKVYHSSSVVYSPVQLSMNKETNSNLRLCTSTWQYIIDTYIDGYDKPFTRYSNRA